MERTETVDDWTFEVVQLRARKTKKHRDPYTAVANITVADGVPHIEGLLSKDKFSRADYRTFSTFLTDMGFKDYEYTRAE